MSHDDRTRLKLLSKQLINDVLLVNDLLIILSKAIQQDNSEGKGDEDLDLGSYLTILNLAKSKNWNAHGIWEEIEELRERLPMTEEDAKYSPGQLYDFWQRKNMEE